ncbi:MAG: hypothetical protein FWC70_08665 [Defluviitaleaceae bacterium]|nr:hypothetical protein [Defluviitaleaceae bacterium]
MKKLFAICTFLILILLTGCATDNPPRFITYSQEAERTDGEGDAFAEPVAFDVFFRRENANFSMYEPAEGTYAAAWLSPDAGIRGFEYAAGMRHAVYVNEVYLGDDIDIAWLLHCIASNATPLFVVHPPDNPAVADIDEIDLATILAQRLGSFNVPMFVAFYPEHDLPPREFVALFRGMRNAFLTHAPQTAVVWVTPCYTSTPQSAYYPGHFVTDWVAVPLLADWSPEKGFRDVMPGFRQFYTAFSEHKPIMILPLGVSHFTRGDYSYRIAGASEEILRIYSALENFPRLGLIAYADSFTITRMYSDDFSVSRETGLIRAYSLAAARLLPTFERDNRENSRWIRSAHHGYFFDNELFISPQTLETELRIPTPAQTLEINNQIFASAALLSQNTFACQTRNIIFIEIE